MAMTLSMMIIGFEIGAIPHTGDTKRNNWSVEDYVAWDGVTRGREVPPDAGVRSFYIALGVMYFDARFRARYTHVLFMCSCLVES